MKILFVLVGLLIMVSIGWFIVAFPDSPRDEFFEAEIFSDAVIIEQNFNFGWMQEDSWSAWVNYAPDDLEKKIISGIWARVDYFHITSEYGPANDFHEGISAFIRKFPESKPEELIFLIANNPGLDGITIRCVASKGLEASYVYTWGDIS
ncbi:MAG: hypothetical protein AAF546_13585 [Verrucomicrobiota bacterium]